MTQQIFEMVLIPLATALTSFLVYWLHTKINTLKKETDNATAQNYLTLLDDTITACVIATNQTYTNSLKEQGKFDAEAQKQALAQTTSAVLAILTEDAKKYLETFLGDLDTYLYNRIEAEVLIQKEAA